MVITKYKRKLMTDDCDPKLDTVLADLQLRYGSRIIAPAKVADVARLSTGNSALDEQLAGGLALRKLTQITGQPTSGATSLSHHAIARTQADGGHTVYIDLAGQFDPVTAARCGVDLASLLLVRPSASEKVAGLVRDLMANGSSSLMVLDAYCATLVASAADARRMQQALAASSCALVLISDSPPAALTVLADICIHLDLLGWLRRGGTISGLHTRATVEDARGKRTTLLELRYETVSS